MRQFRSPGLPRLAPAMVTGLVAASSLLLGPAPARAEGAPVACVLSLNNLARPSDPELGKLAAQRLASALEKTGTRVIVSEERLQQALADLEGEAPYDRVGRFQLAAKIEAGQVIYGTFFSTRFTKAPKAQGRVRLMVMVEAPGSGQVQALSIEGAGPVHKVAKEEAVLLNEALDNAGAQLAAKLHIPGTAPVAPPVLVASAGGGIPAPLVPLVQPTAVVSIPLVTAQDVVVATNGNGTVPPPVVVDAPGIDRDLQATGLRRRQLISTKTIRTVVGGVLLLALLGLAGGGPLGALGVP